MEWNKTENPDINLSQDRKHGPIQQIIDWDAQ
jgi:hypothetical protein